MESSEKPCILYGTPLEPLDDDETPNKKPIQDLTVRDEQGRRRFHGAFTGGFSAGYYNTVGTEEGWAPSTFVSSRHRKAGSVNQKPEDFMDPEDLNEFGIAPKQIKTTKNFSQDEKKIKGDEDKQSALPGRAPLKDLVQPISSNIGARLLTGMGWKEGQGIGPRYTKDIKIYGCSMPPTDTNSTSEDNTDPHAALFTFAPRDIAIIEFKIKDNLHGLGYTGINRVGGLFNQMNDFSKTSTARGTFKSGQNVSFKGHAFGVGALETEDGDIYTTDDMSQYDFTMEKERKKKKENRKGYGTIEELPGFVLSTKPKIPKQIFPPPDIPKEYRPIRLIAYNLTNHKEIEIEPEMGAGNKYLNRHILTSEDRAKILGNRFQKRTEIVTLPKIAENCPKLDFTVKEAFGQFKPFGSQPEKQRRYQIFLENQKKRDQDAIKAGIGTPVMTEWEKEKEKEEFERAHLLYRPLSSLLSNRFVSKGVGLEDDHKELTEAKLKRAKEAEEFVLQNVKMKRSVVEWHPDKLLCKRFNIPNPFPDNSTVEAKKEVISIFGCLDEVPNIKTTEKSELIEEREMDTLHNLQNIVPVIGLLSNVDQEPIPPKEQEIIKAREPVRESRFDAKSIEDATVAVKPTETPTIDLFKAIFLDSDKESEDEEEIEKDEPTETTKAPINVPESAPTGVFASLSKVNEKNNESSTVVNNIEKSQPASLQAGFYGPSLPPCYDETSNGGPFDLPQKDLEKYSIKSSKHRRKERKKKKKHKNKKRKHESSSSSESLDDDVTINQKLRKKLKSLKK